MISQHAMLQRLTEVLAAFSPAARLGFVVLCIVFALSMSFSFASTSETSPVLQGEHVNRGYRPLITGNEGAQHINPWRYSRRQVEAYGSPHRLGQSLWQGRPLINTTLVPGNRPWGNVGTPKVAKGQPYRARKSHAAARYSYGDLNPYEPAVPDEPFWSTNNALSSRSSSYEVDQRLAQRPVYRPW